MSTALVLLLLAAYAQVSVAQSGGNEAANDKWLCEWLVLEPTGKRSRAPIPVDGLTYELARGDLARPAAGGVGTSVTGERRVWKAATANDDGWLRVPALRGGHAAVTVPVHAAQTMLLEAAGHSVVYCNGIPRAGDPYGTGFVRLPVRLRAGENDLIFRVTRGRVRARLVPMGAEARLNADDVTLPDALVGEHGELLGAIVVINGASQPLGDAWIEAQLGSRTRMIPRDLLRHGQYSTS